MAVTYPCGLDETTWKAHDLAVNQCRGRLFSFAIAGHFGLPPDDVDAIERRCQAGDAKRDDDVEANGTIRRWCTDGNRPRIDSIQKILEATQGCVDLRLWINHPLIALIRREPPSVSQLNRYLEQAPAPVRRILCLAPDQRGDFSHHIPERRTVLALRNTWSFDGFLAMLCLARRGEVLESDPAHALPAKCAYDMFPRIVSKVPIIQFQWRQVAHCLHRIFWDRVYDGAIRIDLPTDTLFNNVERVAASPRVRYILKSGRRLSDEQHLEFEFAKLRWERDRLRIEAQQKIDQKLKSAEIERLFASIRARLRLS